MRFSTLLLVDQKHVRTFTKTIRILRSVPEEMRLWSGLYDTSILFDADPAPFFPAK
jgi:hypothetical protein